jgi:phage gp46-like protein
MIDFEGDILLVDSPDGGEIVIENGLIKNDKQFTTAVYLSLFGGNLDDPGKTKSKRSWWGNIFAMAESEKIRSRFQFIINGYPMTVKYIREAETAALLDLEWMKKEKIADEINVTGRSIDKDTFELYLEILADQELLYKNTFSLQWEGEKRYAV